MIHILVIASNQEGLTEAQYMCKLCLGITPPEEQVFLLGGLDELPANGELPCAVRLKAFQEAEENISAFLERHDSIHDRFIGLLALPQTRGGHSLYPHPDSIPALERPEGALILAFPEIQWIPIYDRQYTVSEKDELGTMSLIRAWTLCQGGYSPLFDGDGLRSCLMARLRRKNLEQKLNRKNYVRPDVAVSVDEETSFAFMNAYAAYRFGYRAFPVTSLTAARDLLTDRSHLPQTPRFRNSAYKPLEYFRKFWELSLNPLIIVFEDVKLSFSDSANDAKAHEKVPPFGALRDTEFPLLQEADLRIVATASRPDEKIAVMQSGENATAREFFLKEKNSRQGRYRALWGLRTEEHIRVILRCIGEKASRWWFNVSGDWAGHWMVKSFDAVLMAGLLIGVLFWKASLFLPVLCGLFVLQGFLRQTLQEMRRRKGMLPEWARMYLLRKSQWRFLPKRYKNHCPENGIIKNHEKDNHNTYWTTMHKPLAGIFGLRNECCLPNGRMFNGIDDTEQVKEQYRIVKSKAFADPNAVQNNHELSHAAPGMALEIAIRLLRRAERLEKDDKIIDAEGAIYGAVLATVAGELLDAKTPAVSIEALTWKQFFEIRAECEFVGVRAHTDMEDRYIDIHNAMGRICRSSNGFVRENVFNSGMAELMDKLSSLLSEKGKMEEALFFEKKARMFHRRLMGPIARTLLAYPEWLLRSAWHVVIGLVILISVFCLFWIFRITPPNVSLYSAITNAYEILFCDEPNFTEKAWENYSIVLRSMRLVTMLHLAFLGLCFWDVMRKK